MTVLKAPALVCVNPKKLFPFHPEGAFWLLWPLRRSPSRRRRRKFLYKIKILLIGWTKLLFNEFGHLISRNMRQKYARCDKCLLVRRILHIKSETDIGISSCNENILSMNAFCHLRVHINVEFLISHTQRIKNKMGWLSGLEPELTGPQPVVLPLHHSHHKTTGPGNYTISLGSPILFDFRSAFASDSSLLASKIHRKKKTSHNPVVDRHFPARNHPAHEQKDPPRPF